MGSFLDLLKTSGCGKVLDLAGAIILAIDARQKVTFINQKGTEILGLPKNKIVGKNWFNNFIPEHIRPLVKKSFEGIIKGDIIAVEYLENPVLHKSGEERIIAWHNTVLENQKGAIIGTLSSGEDITERKKVEGLLIEARESLEKKVDERTRELKAAHEKLIRSERLAALGKLAGIVSHELRNPLGVIRNAVYCLGKDIRAGEDKKIIFENLGIIEEEIKIADRIINDILAYGKIKPPTFESHDIGDVVREAIARTDIPDNIRVNVEIDDNVPCVFIDNVQMCEVCLNMIKNACDAMRDGGTLTIMVRRNTENVLIEFKDTGIGIPKENIETIFDPLFSTKAQGTGLGLPVCQRIVEMHDGKILVKSKPGYGALFIVTIPIEKCKRTEG